MNNIFHTLRYRNYRLFFAGQGVSLVGTWMQAIALSWLVYKMTNSAFMLGLVGFASQIPTFVLSPFAGVYADRWNKHRILVATQVLSMLQALVMATLTLSGTIEVWHIITLSIFLGCVNSLDIPARQSFVIDMVEKKENLGNAIALNSLMFNGARLIGPSIAGILIAMVGEGWCFLINGLSFLAVIVSLLFMKTLHRKKKSAEYKLMDELKEGFRYTFGFAPIRFILTLLAVTSVMGMSYTILMPVFARDVLHGGPSTLGFLMASSGIGSLAATLYLASRKTILGLGRLIPISALMFSLGLITFSISHTLWFSVMLLIFIGFGFMVNMAASNTIIQTIADDDKRGRVMSFYTMSFMGMAPIGSLLTGFIAGRIGAANTLIIGGGFCMLAAIVFAAKLPIIKALVHPIYKKAGIILN